MSPYRKKLIEVAIPLDEINHAAAREKKIRVGHPSTLHLWWARRPLAAARAVLFSQLVDAPSSWPEYFPDEEAQTAERKRLFGIVGHLVQWESTTSSAVISAAQQEIAASFARGRLTDGIGDSLDRSVLAGDVASSVLKAYLKDRVPYIHDPFCGAGTIALEAKRLGLNLIATDLNPIAVLISLVTAGLPESLRRIQAVNPDDRKESLAAPTGAKALASDVAYYGRVLERIAHEKLSSAYPDVRFSHEGKQFESQAIAWLWARTVRSPDPARRGVHVPIVSTYWLCRKKKRVAWLDPVIDRKANTWKEVDPISWTADRRR